MSEYTVPIQIEVMLPAFCMGMMTYEHANHNLLSINASLATEEYNQKIQDHLDNNLITYGEQDEFVPNDTLTADEIAHFVVSSGFMILVGLSMPPVFMGGDSGVIAYTHTVGLTMMFAHIAAV